jgi:alkylation response protein AidB-like acyl-CoA dehydrogenase
MFYSFYLFEVKHKLYFGGITMSLFDKNISKEKLKSLEFAEEQRQEQWQHPSFALQLFHGHPKWSLIHPFPLQDKQDAQKGDQFVAKLEQFLKDNLNPDEVDRTGQIPDHVMEGLGKLGCFAMKIPTEYGGLGLSQYNYNRAMHLLASYCGSTAVLLSAHQSIGVPQPLKLFGTEEQKKKYFPRFAEGKVSAFALTEPTVGSDPRSMLTTAHLSEDGSCYILNGEKLWCTNGLIADVVVVMAVTPSKMVNGKERKQITAFIVEMDSPGIEKIHRCEFLGLKGIQNGLIRFKDVKVPKENIILKEGEGLKLALTTLNTGRLTLPAASAGISKWCLNVARRWSVEREQWGGKIGEHESVALKLGYIASHTFAIDAITWLTSAMADDHEKDIRLEAAMAKYFCTHHSWKIVDETLQIRGGQGYETANSLRERGMHPWPVERVLRDVRINLIIEGTSEIMHLFIAREALDPHLQNIKGIFSAKSMGQKLGAVGKMMLYYAKWYPTLFFPSLFFIDEVDSRLIKHVNYVQKTSKRLAKEVFANMMKYQKKLEAKQAVLNRIVDIGTELFAMAAVCSYANALLKNDMARANAWELADLYCRDARMKIEGWFKNSHKNTDRFNIEVSKKILSKDYEWMEEEIIKQ